MTINEYQQLAMTTLNPALDRRDVLINGVMGLCGEAGEAIDIVKKHLAQGHELDREKLAKELGDIAWYLAETAYAIGYPLEDILDRFNVHISDFYDSENKCAKVNCRLEFASRKIENIRNLKSIIGKRVYNKVVTKNGDDFVELVIE